MCSPRQLAPPSQAIENLYSTAGLHPPIAAPTATVARAFFVYGRCVCLRRRPKARSRAESSARTLEPVEAGAKAEAEARSERAATVFIGTVLDFSTKATSRNLSQRDRRPRRRRPSSPQEKPSWSRLNNNTHKIAAAAAATLPTERNELLAYVSRLLNFFFSLTVVRTRHEAEAQSGSVGSTTFY